MVKLIQAVTLSHPVSVKKYLLEIQNKISLIIYQVLLHL